MLLKKITSKNNTIHTEKHQRRTEMVFLTSTYFGERITLF